jgi:hypothetical protein
MSGIAAIVVQLRLRRGNSARVHKVSVTGNYSNSFRLCSHNNLN